MKRVMILYRVSTKKQVDRVKDDIPMQRIACHDFVEEKGWVIVKELYEKGISGFKVSAANRDAIVELKEYAIKKEFDVLLVYMFDRLGRIDSETPFVLEWFVANGIEVWSTQEGQQKIESHADRLTNYVRFWQANGESRKTSMRLKTVTAQMVSAGVYRGGTAPFGYKTVHLGRVNKKGQPVKDMVIEEREAEIIKLMTQKTLKEGYGSYRLAELLNDMGVRTHNGSKFTPMTVIRILRNKLICGYYFAGDTVSEKVPEWVILEENEFNSLQYILDQRMKKSEEKQHIAKNTKGKALLSGNIFCGHCGCRLNVAGGKENYINSEGKTIKREIVRYTCYHRVRKLNDCDGQSVYSAKRIDEIVEKIVKDYLERIKKTPKDKALELRYENEIEQKKKMRKKLNSEMDRAKRKLKELSDEVGKSVVGESAFSVDVLSMAINTTKTEITNLEQAISDCEKELEEKKDVLGKIDFYYEQFLTWADEFENATNEQKKMIVCQLIKSVTVKKGYKLDIEFNVSYRQFIGIEETAA